ncbi:hypothetical protein AURDEDRAFT_160088 [Auricularia subglabra TFB-10046 SS5]|nr:hypothetical protein AURDEDRAFT_160088 [Auricularia subglabra TFB-10046 SS5]
MITLAERLERRGALQGDLERYTARHALLIDKLARAQARRDEAAAALQAAEACVARLRSRCNDVKRDCASIRRLMEFDPDTVNTLPVELLRAIWAEVRPPDQPWKSVKDTRRISELRLLVPGRLAAVCRHWRQVALNTPELWTDVGLPPIFSSPKYQQSFLAHVELQMHRSLPRPLDIVLLHMHARDEHAALRCFEAVLRTTSRHAARWHRVKLWFPPQLQATLLDDILLGSPMPLLEDLHIVDSAEAAMTGLWLADAPSLHSFGIRGFRFEPPPLLQLHSVVTAHIDIDVSLLDHFWAALRALPSLRSLSLLLESFVDDMIAAPVVKVSLCTLDTLKLRGNFCTYEALLAPTLSASRLKRLNIEVGAVEATADWGRAFFAAFPSVDELELVGDGNFITHQQWVGCGAIGVASPLTALARITHLRCVSFLNCRFRGRTGDTCRHSRLFLALDSEGDPKAHGGDSCRDGSCPPPCLVWPKLESLTICSVSSMDAREELLVDLACFSRTRAVACNARGKDFSFALLSWPLQFPSWFREALGAVLGPAHVHLTTSDGMAHAPVADNDEDDPEPEAVFTDSDEGSASGDSSSSGESEWDGRSVGDTDREWVPDAESGTDPGEGSTGGDTSSSDESDWEEQSSGEADEDMVPNPDVDMVDVIARLYRLDS